MTNTETNIEELYNKYSQRLYFASLRIVGNSFEAEEIMQDTFIKYHTFPNKKEIQEIVKWLMSICIRKSIDTLRSRNRLLNNLDEYTFECNNNVSNVTEEANIEEQESDKHYKVEKIREALYSLPDKYRIILSLHLFEGYDYSEIEEITGIKEGSIRSIYMRGKVKLYETVKNL